LSAIGKYRTLFDKLTDSRAFIAAYYYSNTTREYFETDEVV